MQMRMTMLAAIAAGGVALGLVLGGVKVGKPGTPKQVTIATQKASDPIVEETLRLLEDASSTLAKVDPALDRPMSDSEIADSEDRIEDARRDLLASAYTATSPLKARDLARKSLDLAQEALDSAREGKRERAVKRFTRARIKMQEARLAVDPALTADQRRSLATRDLSLPPPTAEDPRRGSREVFTIRGQKSKGGIFLGPDGLRLEGTTGEEQGAVTIGPHGVRVHGREGSDRGSVHVAPDSVTVEGND